MRRLAVALVVLALSAAPGAHAHGPCHCTTPVAEPGQAIATGPAYLVVWNPKPYYYAGAAGFRYLASGRRDDAPSGVVLERPRPTYPRQPPRGRFRIPRDTPPGIYVALIFDGSEGGQHATWDHVQVIARGDGSVPEAGRLHLQLAMLRDVFPPL